jgi:hypothetical protein
VYVIIRVHNIFIDSGYDNKVDMYSIGVTFFEMCHKPFTTGIERQKILEKLRSPEIVIPDYHLLEENKVGP